MVRFETRFDSSVSQRLVNKYFKKTIPLLIICSSLLVLLGISSILQPIDPSDVGFGIFMVVFGLILVPFTKLLTNLISKKNEKSFSVLSNDTIEVFEFDEYGLEITQTKGDDYVGKTKAKYSYLYRVTSDEKYYYLYISNAQMHLIPKHTLVEGTLSEFENIIKNNMDPNKAQFK